MQKLVSLRLHKALTLMAGRDNQTQGDQSAAADVVKPGAAPSSVSWVRRLQDRDNTNRAILALLFFIAVVLTFYLVQSAAAILIPITFSWLLSTLFYPLVQYARRFKIPTVVSAGAVVALSVGGFALLILLVMEPAAQWVRELPATLQHLRQQLYSLEGALAELQEVTREVSELADLDDEEAEAIAVQIEDANPLRGFLAENLISVMTSMAIIVFLTFFLLASGNRMLRAMTGMGPTLGTKRRIVGTVLRIRSGVAHYLATISAINLSLGVVVAITMHILDVPNPLLWGMVAGVLNFAPYIGPAATLGILALVGVSTFDSLGAALMVPLAFFVLTVLEGQLVTPMVVGRRLAMSPAVVFISVVIWGWLWGVAGALMAVPIVASLKIIFSNIPSLEGLARATE